MGEKLESRPPYIILSCQNTYESCGKEINVTGIVVSEGMVEEGFSGYAKELPIMMQVEERVGEFAVMFWRIRPGLQNKNRT